MTRPWLLIVLSVALGTPVHATDVPDAVQVMAFEALMADVLNTIDEVSVISLGVDGGCVSPLALQAVKASYPEATVLTEGCPSGLENECLHLSLEPRSASDSAFVIRLWSWTSASGNWCEYRFGKTASNSWSAEKGDLCGGLIGCRVASE